MSDILGYLRQKGYSYRLRGNEAVLNCPFCGDKEHHFAVNMETGAFNCMRGSCGARGSFFEFKRRLGDAPVKYVEKTYRKPAPVSGAMSEKVLRWFAGREIKKETLQRFGTRQKVDAIVFPYLRDGEESLLIPFW